MGEKGTVAEERSRGWHKVLHEECVEVKEHFFLLSLKGAG